jgi:L-alanine-DL-glutamate epimerase-like enolase superfamily enzyme
MKISDLEFYLVAVPRSDTATKVRSLIVRIASDTGHEGWGEANLEWRPSELDARRQAMLPILAGRNVFNIEELLQIDALRPTAFKAALEIASWDMIGRAARQPLCHLWGGAYRRRIPLAARLPIDSAEAIAIRARELSERGFHTQIFTATGDLESDLSRLALTVEATGDRVGFRIDGRGGYNLSVARELCGELERYDVVRCLVDPLGEVNLERLAALRRETTVPLGLRKCLGGSGDLFQIARVGAAQQVVLALDQLGGLHPAAKCAHVAEAAEITASLTSGPSLGIGLAAMLQLAAAVPSLATANESAYHELSDDVLTDRLELVDGMVAVPDGPGLGVEIERRKLERYQVT